jgi:DNA-binding response OmpR family regulator
MIPRPRLLIAEDDRQMCEMMRTVLEEDFAVQTAIDGAEAMRMARRNCPDVVLVDAQMPEMDGFETCRALRGRPETAAVPIMMVTGARGPQSAQAAFDAGATDYLPKPFSISQLRSRARMLLLRHQYA